MAAPNKAPRDKRQRERGRLEKQQEKGEKRELRKQQKKDRVDSGDGNDPDLAGIVPGPQPREDF